MITDPRVFRDDHLPRELKHREAEIEDLSHALDPALAGRPAADVLLAGPSGVGKTALARHTLGKLDQFATVAHTHIQCLGESTTDVLQAALDDLPGHSATDAASVDDLRVALREAVDQPAILVLDEADSLPETDVLDVLDDVPLVSFIAVVHDPQRWLSRAPDAVRRAVSGPIQLGRYGVDELSSILRARANVGLRPSVVSDDQLRGIADEVAGVARSGIQVLRAAAEVASERGHARIHDTDIEDAYERAQHRIRRSKLYSLTFHHHVLYGLVHEAGEVPAGELHDRYDAVGEQMYYGRERTPVGRRSRRNKLRKLVEYELVEAVGDSKSRVYRVVDESVTPSLDSGMCVESVESDDAGNTTSF
ncbi:Cdc6/Cdc18 family protein [Halorussus halobius]|uniref:Cdc6/Cdc18 family protein n=1 Tax=Halorussus halobius TaxID=1710537 RepID=UPI0010930A43|nr:AAA family ATPase [Halorussus halobius]